MPTTHAGQPPSVAGKPMDMAKADKKKSMTLMATAVTIITPTCTPPSLTSAVTSTGDEARPRRGGRASTMPLSLPGLTSY